MHVMLDAHAVMRGSEPVASRLLSHMPDHQVRSAALFSGGWHACRPCCQRAGGVAPAIAHSRLPGEVGAAVLRVMGGKGACLLPML